jgi:hypothetical protein
LAPLLPWRWSRWWPYLLLATPTIKPLMNEHDQAAWRDWSGDAVSFGRTLYARCELTSGQNASNCEPYKVAIQ